MVIDIGNHIIASVGWRYAMGTRVHQLIVKEVLEELYNTQRLSMMNIAKITGTNYRLVRDSMVLAGIPWRTTTEAKTGRVMSSVSRDKISKANTGRVKSPETIARLTKILATTGAQGWNRGLSADTDSRMAHVRDCAKKAQNTREYIERTSKRVTEAIASGSYWYRGYYDSVKAGRVYYMSGWEQRRWIELDNDPHVLSFDCHPFAIPYEWNEATHLYTPDVVITTADNTRILEEIKPPGFLTTRHKGYDKIRAKIAAGERYAADNNMLWRIFSYHDKTRRMV